MPELIASHQESARFHARLAVTDPFNRVKWLAKATWEAAIAKALAHA